MPLRRPLLLALLLVACAIDPGPRRASGEAAATDILGRPPYATLARARQRELRSGLLELTGDTQGRARVIRQEVAERLDELDVPTRLASRDAFLAGLRRDQAAAHAEAVAEIFGRALVELDALQADAMDRAVALARALAPERSPLDVGPTGDDLLDRELADYAETLRLDLARSDLEGEGASEARRNVELLQVFTSFDTVGADERLGGRLLVFVGGAEGDDPRADIVLRTAEGVARDDRGLVQAVRLRVLSGETIIEDLGWRPLPEPDGLPAVGTEDAWIVAPDAARALLAQAGSPADLAERRVLADVQTAVFDRDRRVLGGADWRLEFRVSRRGQSTWQISVVESRFNPECTEAEAILAASPAAPGAR